MTHFEESEKKMTPNQKQTQSSSEEVIQSDLKEIESWYSGYEKRSEWQVYHLSEMQPCRIVTFASPYSGSQLTLIYHVVTRDCNEFNWKNSEVIPVVPDEIMVIGPTKESWTEVEKEATEPFDGASGDGSTLER